MKALRGLLVVLLSALLVVVLPIVLPHVFDAEAATPTVAVSTNVASVPYTSSVVLAPLAVADPRLAISSTDAVSEAMSAFGLTADQIDTSVGVVPAVVSQAAHPASSIAGWVVTADVDTYNTMGTSVAHRLCVVVDGQTGKWTLAYVADSEAVGSPGSVG